MLRSKSTNKTNVIKNAVYDAFLDNCQGLPIFEVNEDDFSLSLVFSLLLAVWANLYQGKAKFQYVGHQYYGSGSIRNRQDLLLKVYSDNL